MNSIRSKNSTISDDDTVKSNQEDTEENYTSTLEIAPFPALASLDEITQTLSRVKSNQQSLHQEEKAESVFKHVPYHTEGIRNPGWFSVFSCFFVNFFVFGTTFCWGTYQKL